MSPVSAWGNRFIISAIVQGAIITGFTIMIVSVQILLSSINIIQACSSNVSLLSQKALAQDNNKTAASTNNMTSTITTKADSMMMENKTTTNADTLMTKIRNIGNATIGGSSGSSTVNMTNASTASNMMIGNKSG